MLVEPRPIVSLAASHAIVARDMSGDRHVNYVDFASTVFYSPEKRWRKASDR